MAKRARHVISHAMQRVIVRTQLYAAKADRAHRTCVMVPLGRVCMYSIMFPMTSEEPMGEAVENWTSIVMQEQGFPVDVVYMKKGPKRLSRLAQGRNVKAAQVMKGPWWRQQSLGRIKTKREEQQQEPKARRDTEAEFRQPVRTCMAAEQGGKKRRELQKAKIEQSQRE
eukprot:4818286-Amphidinium_carterae.2